MGMEFITKYFILDEPGKLEWGFENEVDKSFLDDIANNTPHAEQFKEKNLGKKKKRSL